MKKISYHQARFFFFNLTSKGLAKSPKPSILEVFNDLDSGIAVVMSVYFEIELRYL